MKSILTGEEVTYDHIKIEADVIVTATVLGFVGTRYHQGQPISFDYEHPTQDDYNDWYDTDVNPKKRVKDKEVEYLKEVQEFLHVLSAMSFVLEKSDPKLSAFLKEAQSPEGAAGALITGRAGGQSLKPDERHRNIESRIARIFARIAKERPNVYKLYQGRGAYTGMIDDPVGEKPLVYSTKRVIDQDKTRWHPGEIDPSEVDEELNLKPWGLIRGKGDYTDINLRDDPTQGLGPLPVDKEELNDDERIGYIHGMSSAIVQSIRNGPWCTPFEMATGTETTKMASCFACSTYMYAAGFPPSSMHLGRGESWVPPSAHLISGEEKDLYPYDRDVVASGLARWHREIHYYLRLGVAYLLRAKARQVEDMAALKKTAIGKDVIDYVNPTHYAAVEALDAALGEIKLVGRRGGNPFLDALTVHESDWKRIRNTLQPVYEYYTEKADEELRPLNPKEQIEKQIAIGAILAKD